MTPTNTNNAPPVTSEPEDIIDPHVPAAVLAAASPSPAASAQWREHEALLHGFCAQMQTWMREYHQSMMLCMEATLKPVQECLRAAASENEHAQYQLADALLKMQEHGIKVQTTPYAATVHAQTAQGIGLELTIQKTDAQALTEAVRALVPWLEQAGFVGVTPPASRP